MTTTTPATPATVKLNHRVLWTSPAVKIGKTLWCLAICENPEQYFYSTNETKPYIYNTYLFLDTWGTWQTACNHPSYDSNNGSTAGLPASLRKLYDRHELLITSYLTTGHAPQTQTIQAQLF